MVGGGQCDGFRAVDAQRLLEQVIVVERHHAQVAAPRVTQPRNLTRDRPREERVRTRGGREELVGDPRVAFPAGQRVDDRCGPEVTVAGSLGLPALDRAPVGQAMRPCSRAAWRSSRFTSTSQLGSPASIEAPAPTSTVSRAAALACATRAVIGGSEKARKLTARIVAATATCGPGGRDDARAAASRRMAGARARGGHLPASVTAGTSPQARRPRRRPSGRSGSSGRLAGARTHRRLKFWHTRTRPAGRPVDAPPARRDEFALTQPGHRCGQETSPGRAPGRPGPDVRDVRVDRLERQEPGRRAGRRPRTGWESPTNAWSPCEPGALRSTESPARAGLIEAGFVAPWCSATKPAIATASRMNRCHWDRPLHAPRIAIRRAVAPARLA